MQIESATKAERRARKVLSHATKALARATTERVRNRHERRIAKARHALGEALAYLRSTGEA